MLNLEPHEVQEFVRANATKSDVEIARLLSCKVQLVTAARKRLQPKPLGKLTQVRLAKALHDKTETETEAELRALFGDGEVDRVHAVLVERRVLTPEGQWTPTGLAWARQGYTGSKTPRR